MYFDVETAYCEGWFWRTSYNTQIFKNQIFEGKGTRFICVCWKWEGERKVHSLEWNKGNDKKMVYQFLEEVKKADEIIAHNGDKFDVPMFLTRCIKLGIESVPEIKSIDSIKGARGKFSFDSNKLDDIAYDLGIGQKYKTEINWWHQIIQNNCPKFMAKMVKYCKMDVKLLEGVYKKMEGYLKPKTHVGVLMGHDKCSCKYCGEKKTHGNKRIISASGAIRRQMNCSSCGKYYTISESVFQKRVKTKDSLRGKIK